MASVGISTRGGQLGGGGGAATPHIYYCFDCNSTLSVIVSSDDSDLMICPDCRCVVLEEFETPPSSPPPRSIISDTDTDTDTELNDVILPPPPPPLSFFGTTDATILSDETTNNLSSLRIRRLPPPPPSPPRPFPFFGTTDATILSDETTNNLSNLQIRRRPPPPPPSPPPPPPLLQNNWDYFLTETDEDQEIIQSLPRRGPSSGVRALELQPPPPPPWMELLPMMDMMMTKDLVSEWKRHQCAICIEDFEMNQMVKLMPCNHLFHSGCILSWLDLHQSCPVCRYKLPSL